MRPVADAQPEQREIPARPLLRPGFRIMGDSGRLLLEHGHRVVVLEGRAVEALLPRLLPLLDGRRTPAEIAALLGAGSLPAVEHALALLAEHRVVCEGPPVEGRPPHLEETVELLATEADLPPATVAERLEAPVAVLGRSPAATEVRRTLEAAGARVLTPRRWRGARAGLVVAAPGRGEAGALRSWNRRALRTGIPWLPVLPFDGRLGISGPLVLPRETACYECYLLRRAGAVAYGPELIALERTPPAARSTFPLDRLVATIAALQALTWLGARDPRLPGLLQSVELRDGVEIRRHAVLRVPRCPACSGLENVAAPLPWFDLPIAAVAG